MPLQIPQVDLSPFVWTNLRLSPFLAHIYSRTISASTTFKRTSAQNTPPGGVPPRSPRTPGTQPEVIDPRWLLKAIVYVALAALICGYLTLCLLFYQGQWQLILHPKPGSAPLRVASADPQPIRFDAAETGSPRLSGALIPATVNSRYGSYTILYLRGADDSLAQSPEDERNLTILHALGLNVFAFDFRGYGQSDPTHPNQARMTEDAEAAYRYLHDTRATPDANLVFYGVGLGSSLAISLAAAHPAIPALILDSPGTTPLSIALADPRTSLLPVRALFHERFPLEPLARLPTPKLLITPAPTPAESFRTAASPRVTVEIQPSDTAGRTAAIARFLDDTLKHEGVKAPGVQGALLKKGIGLADWGSRNRGN